MFEKKIIILNELNGGFAIEGKRVCAMAKIVLDNNEARLDFFANNVDAKKRKWYLAILADGDFYCLPLADVRGASQRLSLNTADKVSCILAAEDGGVFPVANGSVGRFDGKLAVVLDELVARANGDGESISLDEKTEVVKPDTDYEKFVATTENFYGDARALDVDKLKRESGEKYDAVNDYSAAFERYYAAKTADDYYQSVKDEIAKVFVTFPPFYPLIRLFHDSFFVRIDFPKSDRYFSLGILTDDGDPKYICYALPGKKEGFSDKDFVYVAGSQPNEGFWLLYQDASTGQITARLTD